jgi:hypothetical protein
MNHRDLIVLQGNLGRRLAADYKLLLQELLDARKLVAPVDSQHDWIGDWPAHRLFPLR